MRIAAELGEDAGVGAEREIAGHDGNRAAEEAEGRGGHAVVLDGDERGDATAHGFGDEMERVGEAEFRLPDGQLGARRVLALDLAESDAFAEGEGNTHGLWLTYTILRQNRLRYRLSYTD